MFKSCVNADRLVIHNPTVPSTISLSLSLLLSDADVSDESNAYNGVSPIPTKKYEFQKKIGYAYSSVALAGMTTENRGRSSRNS